MGRAARTWSAQWGLWQLLNSVASGSSSREDTKVTSVL
jgi:hypothetical protein